MSARLVVVDDTDPNINYIGPSWVQDTSGSQDTIGNFGPAYRSTLHGTKSSASLSYAFNGKLVDPVIEVQGLPFSLHVYLS